MGPRLEFNNGELFYTDKIPQQQAEKLGEYLVNEVAYFDGRPKSVKIDKDNDSNYIFRAVVIKDAEKDSANIKPFANLALTLSKDVFGNAPVIIEMCDSNFKTLRRIPYKRLK